MFIVILLICFLIGLICRIILLETFYIPTESMEDTIYPGDFVLVQKFPYNLSHLRRVFPLKSGHIVVFKSSSSNSPIQIKRCIAMEGQVVEVCKNEVQVYQNNKDIVDIESRFCRLCTIKHKRNLIFLKKSQLFALGDNLAKSHDSRFFGPIDIKEIVGVAVLVLFSVHPSKSKHNLLGRIRWKRWFKLLR